MTPRPSPQKSSDNKHNTKQMKKTTRYIALSLTALPVCILAVSCASDEPTANGRPRYALEVGNITLADYTETP